jgi:hypothetical protein
VRAVGNAPVIGRAGRLTGPPGDERRHVGAMTVLVHAVAADEIPRDHDAPAQRVMTQVDA